MRDETTQEKIENVLQDFVQEIQQGSLSKHLITIYQELGIEP
ncbi:MAG: hypothetical protein ABIH47_01390 [Candidatus Omnitrophota bacterium]